MINDNSKKILGFQDFLNEQVYTAKDVIEYVKDLETPENDIPDYYFDLIKKAKAKFELKTIVIEDLLKQDKSLKEYIDSKEDRYENSEYPPHEDELFNPIVIFNGEVIDGYNRTSRNYHNGEKTIRAYVSI
jgi:hypothetical protein